MENSKNISVNMLCFVLNYHVRYEIDNLLTKLYNRILKYME